MSYRIARCLGFPTWECPPLCTPALTSPLALSSGRAAPGLGQTSGDHPRRPLAPLQAGCWETEPKSKRAIAVDVWAQKGRVL